MLVDGRVRMIVPPNEPVIFCRGSAVETFSSGRAGGGAALKVPLACCRRIEQSPILCAALEKKICILAIHTADECAKRLSVRPDCDEQRRTLHAVNDGRLLEQRRPWVGASGPGDLQSDHNVARLQFRAWEADNHWQLVNFRLPVA